METNKRIKSEVNRLLKACEVARQLNISLSLTYQLMQKGEIPTVHLGRNVRVRPVDLEGYISANVSRDEVLWAQLS